MKKILILGGSHRDIPLIKASQELGYFVITLGDRDYYLGHKYSDKYYKVNFNDLILVKKIMIDENIDYIIPGSGEESYLKTVQLAKELNIGNFDSLETAKLVHNKWKFKEFCLKNDISTPKGFYYTETANLDKLNFPIVVKPTNLSGGRGVEVVFNLEDLHKSLQKAQEFSDEIFLEEFIEGELIAYSIFLKKQKIVYEFTGKDDTYKNKYLITTAYPIELEIMVSDRMKYDIEKIAKLLNLVDGMFHLQIIIKNNIPYIIDVTRRIPGDFYPNLMEYCDNIKYTQAVVNAYIGKKLNNELKINENQKFIIRHCVMSDKNGIYQDLYFNNIVKDKIISTFNLLPINTYIQNFLTTQIAIIFIELESKNKEILDNINSLVKPILKLNSKEG